MRGAALLAFVTAAATSWALPAAACPSCACGVQNPTRLGADIPFAGRARVALVSTTATLREDDMALVASDVTVAGSFAVTDFLVVEGALPLSSRFVVEGDLDVSGRAVGLGDARVGARAVVYRDRMFAPRLLLATRVQAVLPTAPGLTVRNVPVAMALQPGGGAVAVNASVALLARPMSRLLLGVDVGGQTPMWTKDGASAGTTAQLSTSAQLDVTDVVAVRGMASAQGTRAPLADHHGYSDGDEVSERGSVYGGLGLSFTITPSVLAVVDVEVPVATFGDPRARDGARATAGVVYDF